MESGQANGWVWYPSPSHPHPGSAEPELSYRGAPAPNFDDMAPTRVRDPRTNPPAAMEHQVVRLPPLIPANGPTCAPPAGSALSSAPTLANPQPLRRAARKVMAPVSPEPVQAVRSAPVAVSPVVEPSRPLPESNPAPIAPLPPFHWVKPERQPNHTFEFSGTAVKLGEGKSMILGPMDWAPTPHSEVDQTVLRSTGNASWILVCLALVFGAFAVAFMLSSEITVGVNAVWNTVATALSGVSV